MEPNQNSEDFSIGKVREGNKTNDKDEKNNQESQKSETYHTIFTRRLIELLEEKIKSTENQEPSDKTEIDVGPTVTNWYTICSNDPDFQAKEYSNIVSAIEDILGNQINQFTAAIIRRKKTEVDYEKLIDKAIEIKMKIIQSCRSATDQNQISIRLSLSDLRDFINGAKLFLQT
ncbi:MAG: hypothetical protein KatS3mg091_097 [Patescibacteria group bacterium]|nr:MAG: hypothetical protein KatS3mg091_097 [Patescibacteria group bacterium]